jgi:hypothetical protein
MNGNGTLTFVDRTSYTGEFCKDKKEGKGTFRFSDGAIYEG